MQRYRDNPRGSSLLLEAWFLNQVVSRWMTDRLGDSPVSPDELGLCAALVLHGDAATSQICDLTGAATSTIASMGNRLAGRGLLEQIPHPNDRRVRLWRLTSAGGEVVREAMERFAEAYRSLLAATALRAEQARSGLNDLEQALRHDLDLPQRPLLGDCTTEESELTPTEQQELRQFRQWLIHRRGHHSSEVTQ